MREESKIVYRRGVATDEPLLAVSEYGTHRISTQIVNRRLDTFAAVLVESGRGKLRSEAGGEQVVTAPTIFFLWPGMAHSYGPEPGSTWDEQWALFEGRLAEDILASAQIAPARPLLQLHDLAKMRRLFSLLSVEMDIDSALGQAMAGARIHHIAVAAALQNQIEGRQRNDHPITPAIEALQQRAFESVDLIRLADEFSMSPATMRRKFIAAAGMPPKTFQLRMRLDRAKEMLAITDTAIETIANQIGFSDAFYFSRIFARHEGISPSLFRSRNRRS